MFYGEKMEEQVVDTEQRTYDFIRVEFAGNRRLTYRNSQNLPIKLQDLVIVEVERGIDLGEVIQVGELVEKSLEKEWGDLKEVIRIANEEDIEHLNQNRRTANEAHKFCMEKIVLRDLKMKMVNVEVQYDNNKITFYFTADKRVDFRELVKDLASHFRTRIELRQIGVRDEAARLDGCGLCGRGYCCSSWIIDFLPVTLTMARDQSLSLSPTKMSGACGRLLCCLRYENDLYQELLAMTPELGSEYEHEGAKCTVSRVDPIHNCFCIINQDGKEISLPIPDKKLTDEKTTLS
jgi:cell fate regulator YaaT (PSP1 superfamily)